MLRVLNPGNVDADATNLWPRLKSRRFHPLLFAALLSLIAQASLRQRSRNTRRLYNRQEFESYAAVLYLRENAHSRSQSATRFADLRISSDLPSL